MPLCTKIKHRHFGSAIKHMSRLKNKYGGSYGAYYCASCNSYHVTSNTSGNGNFVKFKG